LHIPDEDGRLGPEWMVGTADRFLGLMYLAVVQLASPGSFSFQLTSKKDGEFKMTTPRYTEQEIWDKLNELIGCEINSLTDRKTHLLVSADQADRTYLIQYESGNTKRIKLDQLYALYAELHLRGELSYQYMGQHVKQILGWSQWHAPGSAMMAILPVLDERIVSKGGTLFIRPQF